jgi:shikimate kinase
LGPSGVGKTTLVSAAIKLLAGVQRIDVDDEIRGTCPSLYAHAGDKWDEFFRRATVIIERRRTADAHGILLVDFGAGSLQAPACLEYLANAERVLLVWASAEEVYKRHQTARDGYWKGRSLEQFTAAEYGSSRCLIYGTAKQVVTVGGLGVSESVTAFIAAVQSILARE